MTTPYRRLYRYLVAILLVLCPLPAAWGSDRKDPIGQIEHLIVSCQKNWSFDRLSGKCPGADGLARGGAAVRPVDRDGKPLDTLPHPLNSCKKPAEPDARFPAGLPVAPNNLALFATPVEKQAALYIASTRTSTGSTAGKMTGSLSGATTGAWS